MTSRLLPTVLLLGLAIPAAYAQSATAPVAVAPGVVATQPVRTPAMRDLMQSAQQLRESIQALAQKAPGPERKIALDSAREALRRTQQAMLDLPPQYRATGTQASTAGYDPSVRQLMKSADDLRASIHAMAREPAGPGRNQAIRDSNRALLDIQAAMANAYDLTAFRNPQTTTTRTMHVAVDELRCDKLAGMLACHR